MRSPFCSLASRSVIVDDEQGSWWECFLSTSTWCWRYMRTRWPRVQQLSSRLCSSVHFALPRNSMSSKWSESKHLLENIPWVPYYHATALIHRLPPTGLVINLTFAFGSILVVSAWVCDRISSFFQWVVCSVSMKIKVLRGPFHNWSCSKLDARPIKCPKVASIYVYHHKASNPTALSRCCRKLNPTFLYQMVSRYK